MQVANSSLKLFLIDMKNKMLSKNTLLSGSIILFIGLGIISGCSLIGNNDEKSLDMSKYPTFEVSNLQKSYASEDSIKLSAVITDKGMGKIIKITVDTSLDSITTNRETNGLGNIIIVNPPQSTYTLQIAEKMSSLIQLKPQMKSGESIWIRFVTRHEDGEWAILEKRIKLTLK